MLERLKEIANFEYLVLTEGNPNTYQFGWKDGLHFYLDDYFENDEYEGRYVLVGYLNKTIIVSEGFSEIEPLIEKIKQILNEN